ncbi:MAG TPA: protoheme IX farnesyltransferase [Phycisphaerales bacterium]|nr:protoheme IX farnesyltransferase [Phycisphaerales bacterium]
MTKPRITRLVTITSGVGFALGAIAQTWEWKDLVVRGLACLLGTGLSAAGANALNQWWERDRDAAMPRTCARPLPTERVHPSHALGWGIVLSIAGVGLLGLLGLAPALVSLATILIYVLLYTPLKPVTTINTLIGAIPGALPPLIGWAAAKSGNALWGGHWTVAPLLEVGGWSLFSLMFVWQIPHFLAIAWMYRDDYAKGGYRMLPISDPDGHCTASTILLWAILLIPATLAPALVLRSPLGSTLGWTTVAVALGTGTVYVWLAARLWRSRSLKDARRVFFASIMHLPLLLMVMVGDALIRSWLR